MIAEAIHLSALAPLIAVLLFGRHLGVAWWMVALAFSISWIGDSMAHFTNGSWTCAYLWMPVQFALVILAFVDNPLHRMVVLTGLLLLTVTSAQISLPGPDWLLTLVGSIVVLAVAEKVLAWPLMVYFGIGSIAYLVMIARISTEGFATAWWWYQGSREMAIALFVALLFYERRRVST